MSLPPFSPGGEWFEPFEPFLRFHRPDGDDPASPGFFYECTTRNVPSMQRLPFYRMDRVIVVPDVQHACVILVVKESGTPPNEPGYGCAMTVREAARLIKLLRQSLDAVEQGPQVDFPSTFEPGSGERPPWVDEDEPYT